MKEINLFFAVDDNYCPFLSATLHSILANASKNNKYNFYVLITTLSQKNKDILFSQLEGNSTLQFVEMQEKLEALSQKLVTRDYYTKSTYYRLFIPEMFPNLDKALYLDCDLVLNEDVANLYTTNLGKNLVGAAPDSAVQNNPIFIDYVENGLGIKAEKYFNAGVLLMNLKEMRKWKFEDKFIDLLGKYTFTVAQDQDYLNVLTKGRVKYLDFKWNVMPIENNICPSDTRHLIHYNMLWKPWVFDGTLFEDEFWSYARACPMHEEILSIKNSITDEERKNKLQGGAKLLELAMLEAQSPDNYFCKYA